MEGLLFPLQILVTGNLDKKLHAWLHSLTYSLEYGDVKNLLSDCSYLEDSIDRKNAGVIVDFISNVNENVFLRILKEDDYMTEAIKKLVAPELVSLRLIIEDKNKELANKDAELENNKRELANKDAELENNKKELANRDAELENNKKELANKDAEIERLKQQLMKVKQQNNK